MGQDGSHAYIIDGLLPDDCTCRVAAMDAQRGRLVMAVCVSSRTDPG